MVDNSTIIFLAGVGAVAFAASYMIGGDKQSSQEPSRPPARRAVTEDMVDVVTVLLPQVDRQVIRADLEQTRNVEATTTRLLDRLQSGQLQPTQPSPASAQQSAQIKSRSRASGDSLLAKYNIQGDEKESETPVVTGWQASREDREAQLKAQQREMVLKARQKLLEKQKKAQAQA